MGKALSEAETSSYSDVVTLTLCDVNSKHAGRYKSPVSVWHTKNFDYKLVQDYLKRLRFHMAKLGIKVRFMVVAEYGEKKGRVHYHMMRFFQGGRPPEPKLEPDGRCIVDDYWPHGHVYYEKLDLRKARYVVCYISKTLGNCLFRYSTAPAIGWRYIAERLIPKFVENRLSPRKAQYQLPSYPGWYWPMTPHTATKMCLAVEALYYEKLGEHPAPSEWMDRILDNYARTQANDDLSDWTDERWAEHLRTRGKNRRRAPSFKLDGEEKESAVGTRYTDYPPVFFDEKMNAYYSWYGYKDTNGQWVYFKSLGKRWWSFDDNGERTWASSFATESQALKNKGSFAREAAEAYRMVSYTYRETA